MSDETRVNVISIFAIFGALAGLVFSIVQVTTATSNIGQKFIYVLIVAIFCFLIGICLPSIPFCIAWIWNKVNKIAGKLFRDKSTCWIIAALVILYTYFIYPFAAVIVSIRRFVMIKQGYSTEHWGKVENNKNERGEKMSSTVLGKWVAIDAPHKIEFLSGNKCKMYSPADGETIFGTYSVSGNKIFAIIDGDTKITFESLPNNTIQMLPPAGRALPPLPFKRA